ncbi:type II secretion system F family protein [Agromyces sp. CCNWLW203]|uniref:type II secretion system F family protein n=1 Tax=Agromyces sp. CCNWLW203 TaxID=3112842 RepID=UPI002F96AFE3
MPEALIYLTAGLTALALGTAVFLLVAGKRRANEGPSDDQEPVGVPVQRGTIGVSLVAASPRGFVSWVDRQLVLAGRPAGWNVSGFFIWKVVLAVVGVLLGVVFVSVGGATAIKVVLAIGGATLLFFLPDVMLHSRATERQQAITLALPDTLDQMTIAVEAGLGFDAAMAKAARGNDGPLATELIRVLQDMSLGRTRRDGFSELERRTSSEDLRRFARAVIQADAYGIAIANVLRVQAGEMRLKRRQRAELQAQKIAVKILFPLVFCLLPVMFIVILTPAVISAVQTFAGP